MIPQDAIRRRIKFDSKPFCKNDGTLRVLLVYKKSRLEVYASDYPEIDIDELDRRKNSSVGHLHEEHHRHRQCLDAVKNSLLRRGIDVEMCYRSDLSFEKTHGKIIVAVGGDGTVLDASHFSKTSPVFGINSDPDRSVGSLCVSTLAEFEALFDQVENEKLRILPVARIGGTLDEDELPFLALNEILVAHQNPAAMSRYLIKFNGETEEQKSSGVWIAAATGSTGATLSAGGHVQSLDDTRIQFVVREPYFSLGKVTKLLSGFVVQEDAICLTSHMPAGQIFFDGPHCVVKFAMGSKIELHSRGQPLFLFVTDEMEYRRTQVAQLRESFHNQMIRELPGFAD